MKTSVIHPSRGRARLAATTAELFLSLACDPIYEYIISLDNDDNIAAYNQAFAKLVKKYECIFAFTCGDNKNVVQAMNRGAECAVGDLLVCISDDFEPCECWLSKITSVVDVSKKIALQINDSYSQPTDTILTLPIITRTLYDELGYIYYPDYTGMFADNDLAELCDMRGYLKRASHITIKHNHYTRKLNPFDATYQRHNTKASWDLGKAILKDRRNNKFAS